jgi:hypothetical protein
MNLEQLARATAAVLWADERDTLEEWAAAERIFTDNGVDWEKAKPVIEEELEALIDESDVESKEDSEEDLSFGVIDFGPGIDPYDILCGLAQLACSDKELTWQEIDIMHRLGESMNVGKELVTAALVKAAAMTNVFVALDEE